MAKKSTKAKGKNVEKAPATEPKLTPKQELFALEYIKDCNGTQAAIRAGYAESGARTEGARLLANAGVSLRVEQLLNERKQRTQIDADYVLEVIVDTIERCRQSRPVLDQFGNQVFVEGKNGQIFAAYAFQPKQVLQGTEQLGKHLKMFTDVKEHKGTIRLEDLLDASFGEGEKGKK